MGFFDIFKKKKKDSKSKVATKSDKIPVEKTELDKIPVEKTELDTTEIKIENKQIIKPKSISDEIRILAKENNERLYFCLNGHVKRSKYNPKKIICFCGLESHYSQSDKKEFENYPIIKIKNKIKEKGNWDEDRTHKVTIENRTTSDKIDNTVTKNTFLKKPTIEKQREKHEKAYDIWSKFDDEKLKRMWLKYSKKYSEKERIELLAKDFQRSKRSIARRVKKIELLEKQNTNIIKIKIQKESIPEKITEFIIKLDNSLIGNYSYAILQWEKPKENGSEIKNYKIQFKNNKEKSWKELNSKISEIKIKLTKGSKYQFKIASENKHGSSEYSIIKEKFVTSSILDKHQQQAVSFSTNNPLLVTAGPGSGKTRVVLERVKDLILNQEINPEKILCVTFTKAGQQEMIKRFQKDQDLDNNKILFPAKNVRTYHALCKHHLGIHGTNIFALKKNANENDNSSEYTDDGKKWIEKYFKKEFKNVNPDDKEKFEQLVDGVSAFKRERLSLNDLKNYLEEKSKNDDEEYEEKLYELYTYFKEYRKYLNELKKKDFDDLLFEMVERLEETDFKIKIKNSISYVIIDEFQDNNFLQFKIIKQLTSSENITAVGDQNQSIYSFQGANIELFKDFKTHYPRYELIPLKNNYRSTPQIVDVSNNFLDVTSEELNSKAITTNQNGPPIHIRKFNVQKTEYDYFIKLITSNVNLEIDRKSIENNKIIDFADFTILVRTNEVRLFLRRYLVSKGIPCRSKGYSTIQYKDKKITKFLSKIIEQNGLNKKSSISELIKKLDVNDKQIILKKLYLDFEEKEMGEDNSINKIMICLANVFKNNLGDKPVSEFMSYINEPNHPKWNFINAVEIRTVHSVKGEEFPYVIISNSNEKHFPLNFRERELKVPKKLLQYKSEESEQVSFTKEESRLYYVAMTRAKFELFSTYSLKNKDGKSLEKSRFLDMLNIENHKNIIDFKEIDGVNEELTVTEEVVGEEVVGEEVVGEEVVGEEVVGEELESQHESSDRIGTYIYKEMMSANTTLDICSPWISTSYIQDFKRLLEKKVKIRIITWNDRELESQQTTIKLLKQIKNEYLKINITENQVHSKIFIKDKKIAITGSPNFTITSLWNTPNFCDIYYKKKDIQQRIDSFDSYWYAT